MVTPGPPYGDGPKLSGDAAVRLQNLIKQIRHILPFDFYCVVGQPPSAARAVESITFYADNLPDAFRQTYLASRWFESDPVFLAACTALRALRTPEIRTAADSDAVRRTFAEMAETLGPVVAAVALRLRGRLVGVVALWRGGSEFSDDELEFLELVAPALLLTATGQSEVLSGELTARERECLSWTSVGKTAWEIGSILGISEHTAVAHLNSAVRKLDATSRAHAVAEALRRGLID